jgi:hypothetical protein
MSGGLIETAVALDKSNHEMNGLIVSHNLLHLNPPSSSSSRSFEEKLQLSLYYHLMEGRPKREVSRMTGISVTTLNRYLSQKNTNKRQKPMQLIDLCSITPSKRGRPCSISYQDLKKHGIECCPLKKGHQQYSDDSDDDDDSTEQQSLYFNRQNSNSNFFAIDPTAAAPAPATTARLTKKRRTATPVTTMPMAKPRLPMFGCSLCLRETPLPGKDWLTCQAKECSQHVCGQTQCTEFLLSHQNNHLKRQQEDQEEQEDI